MEPEYETIATLQTKVRNLLQLKSEDELFRAVLEICRKLENLLFDLKHKTITKREVVESTLLPATSTSSVNFVSAEMAVKVENPPTEQPPRTLETAPSDPPAAGTSSVFLPPVDVEEDVLEIMNPEDDDADDFEAVEPVVASSLGKKNRDSNKANVSSSATSGGAKSGVFLNGGGDVHDDDSGALVTFDDDEDGDWEPPDKRKKNADNPVRVEAAKQKQRLEPKVYKCSICEATMGITELHLHMAEAHGKARVLRCSRCKRAFDEWSDLLSHTRKKPRCKLILSRILKRCHVCHQYFNPREVAEHRKVCLVGGYKCQVCEKLFETRPLLRKHVRIFSKRVPCPKCTRTMDRHAIDEHMPACDGTVRELCEDCGIDYFPDYKSFLRHKKKHLEKEPIQIPCPKGCNKIFTNVGGMRMHVSRMHVDEMPFKCHTCNIGYEHEEQLKQHVARHGKSVRCEQPECLGHSRVFRDEQQLAKHVKQFHSNVLLKCHICAKIMRTMTGLKNHVKAHAEPGRSCPECGKWMKNRSHETLHMRRHYRVANNYFYNCPQCSFKAHHPDTMNRHVKRAHGPPRYSCQLCDKVYRNISSVEKHRRSPLHRSNLKTKGLVDIRLLKKELYNDPRMTGGTWTNWGRLEQFVSVEEAERIMAEEAKKTVKTIGKPAEPVTPMTEAEEAEMAAALANII